MSDHERIQGATRQALRELLDAAVRLRRGHDPPPEPAAEFLLFKLWAAAHAREEIIRTIQGGVTSLRYMPESLQPDFRVGPISVETRDRAALNVLHLWTDAFLLEIESVADALAQLVNVICDLGLSADDRSILNNTNAKLETRLRRLGASGPSGLEAWVHGRPTWLDDLQELRNQATHRHLVRLVEIKSWEQRPPAPGPGKWSSDFVVDVRPGVSQPLIEFVATSYDEVLNLLKGSLDRLRVVLELTVSP